MFKKSIIPLLGLVLLSSTFGTNYQNNSQFILNLDKKNRATAETTLEDTVAPETNLTSPVFVNTYIDSLATLEKIKDENPTISNVILYVDENLDVVDENNVSLGIKFYDAISNYLLGKYLPVIYIKDENTKTSFIDYIDNTKYFLDSAVCSSSYSILKEIRSSTSGKNIRAIVDASFLSGEDFVRLDILKETNKCFANTVILNENEASEENIRYFIGRFKSVWLTTTKQNKLEIMEYINRGIYGIVSKNYNDMLSVFNEYANSQNKKKNINRYGFNIAHRGSCMSNFENSIEGFDEAFSLGASHIEIDIQVTSDKQLIVMHDDTLNRTTNYSGSKKISEMTKEEIKNYQITKNINGLFPSGVDSEITGVDIPFLDELFAKYKGNDRVIIVELKCADDDLVSLFKEVVDKYDMYDQIVCISFYNAQLLKMKELIPEVPCATLNSLKETMFNKTTSEGVVTLNTDNFTSDFNQGVFSKEFDRKLAERGFLGFYWTYEATSNIYSALGNGVLGVTNNACSTFKDIAIKLLSNDDKIEYDASKDLSEFTYEFAYKTYTNKKSEEKLSANIVSYIDQGDYYDAIFGAEYKTSGSPRYKGVVFSDIVKVYKVEKEKDPETPIDEPTDETNDDKKKSNTNLALVLGLSIPGGIIVIGLIILSIILIRKRKNKKNG